MRRRLPSNTTAAKVTGIRLCVCVFTITYLQFEILKNIEY